MCGAVGRVGVLGDGDGDGVGTGDGAGVGCGMTGGGTTGGTGRTISAVTEATDPLDARES